MINKLYIATDSTESFRFIIVDSTELVQSVRDIIIHQQQHPLRWED